VGSYEPFFYPDSIENMSYLLDQTKLWKIHGSLGWHLNEEKGKVIKKDISGDDILIYPSYLKYRDSKKQPYISLIDRLNNFLRLDDSILITCGYSFGDEHINERIISALNTNTTSHVYALFYGEPSESTNIYKMAMENSKISVYSFRTAIIGCKLGEWHMKTEPSKEDTPNVNLYFDEDAPANEKDEKNVEKKGEEIWTGKGKFLLPYFYKLVIFLKSMIVNSKKYKEI